MSNPLVSIVLLVGLVSTGLPEGGQEAATSRPDLVKPRLLSDVTAVVPGRSFHLGVQFDIERGWHIYWVYSGDSGKPTEIEWTLPDGFRAAPLVWPVPTKFVDAADMVSYGYKEKVLLASEITPPKDLKPGQTVQFTAQTRWLVCKEQCVLGSGTLSIELPVAGSPDQVKPANEDAFAAARRQTPIPADEAERVRVKTGLNVDRVRPGDRFEIGLQLTIERGWHIQSHEPLEQGLIATDVFLAPPDVIHLERPRFPAGKVVPFGGGLKLSLYEGRVLVRVPARATADLKPGRIALDGVLVVQVCSDDGTCLRPQYLALSIPIEAAPPGAHVQPANADLFTVVGEHLPGPPTPSQALDVPETERPGYGLAYLLLAAFLAGLILNVMPCVLPVVSIKILSFVQQAGEEPRRVLILGLSFALGMMAFFWALGLLAVAVPVSPGLVLRYPAGTITLTAIIFSFALSLFGVFELHLPGRAAAALGDAGSREGPVGALAKGFLATVLGTSCTAPVVSTVWVSALAAGAPARMLIFTSMGLGMAGPYVILSAKPEWLRFLPRPGAWMETFKQFMGFVMLATALWLLWVLAGQVGGDGLVWTLCFLAGLALALWMIGRTGYGATPARWFSAHVAALGLIAGGAWFLYRNLGSPSPQHATETGQVPPGSTGTSDPMLGNMDYSRSIPWQPYRPGLARELAAAGRVVYLDYTARWCATCQSNKRLVLETQEVRSAMQRLGVIPIEADFTRGSQDIERDLARFNRPSVPLNLVYGPGHVDNPIVLPELLTKERVLQALETAAATTAPKNAPAATRTSDPSPKPSPKTRTHAAAWVVE